MTPEAETQLLAGLSRMGNINRGERPAMSAMRAIAKRACWTISLRDCTVSLASVAVLTSPISASMIMPVIVTASSISI